MENNFTTYKTIGKKGYLGDFATEWWTEKDWENHHKYIEELKTSGEYGKEVEIEITLMDNPLYDKKLKHKNPIESYSIIFLDHDSN